MINQIGGNKENYVTRNWSYLGCSKFSARFQNEEVAYNAGVLVDYSRENFHWSAKKAVVDMVLHNVFLPLSPFRALSSSV